MGKYLAIKNWEKFQKNMGKRDFIKDSTNKDADPDYSKLSAFARYMLDGLQRLRGLHGRNPENDATWIARALLMVRTDRPHVRHAVDTLIAHGFLVPTNQQHDSIDKSREDKKKEKEKNDPEPFEANPEFDGQEEFQKLYALHPKGEDGQDTQRIFHERVIRDATEAKIPETEALARILGAAREYGRLWQVGKLTFVYPLGSWLKRGIYRQNPEMWCDGKAGKPARDRPLDMVEKRKLRALGIEKFDLPAKELRQKLAESESQVAH